MSLNYKNATITNLSSNDDGFIEVKKNNKNSKNSKNNQVNIVSLLPSTQSYDKEYINEIINDNFNIEYSNTIIDAQIDFEDQIENEFHLKTKYPVNSKSKSLHDIIKYHSAHYYKIKQDVHKNKSKYL